MPPVVPALAYHKIADIPAAAKHRCNYVTPSQFAAQLRLLRTMGFQSISFAQYLAFRRGDAELPNRPILITFDDGYRCNLDFALPLLRRFGFSATVFVVSGQLGGTNEWDTGEIQDSLLSADEVRGLSAEGFEIQSHTRSHPNLTQINRERALAELRDSRRDLETLTGKPVNIIAYPWGATDGRVESVAVAAGYEAGVILRRRVNFDDTPLLELRRIGINSDTTGVRFVWDLARLRLRGS